MGMIASLLIANRSEIARLFIRTQILPGTGRGTTKWWRGSFGGRLCLAAPPSASLPPPRSGEGFSWGMARSGEE
jgi:hypothetical protein